MKYRLRTQHVIENAVRNAGTIVGDDEDCAVRYYGDPTPDMEGLDEASANKVNEVHKRLHGVEAPWHRDPENEDARFRPPAVEEPAFEQDRQHASMSAEERTKAEEESAKAMAEENAKYHYQGGTAPPQTIPPAGAGGTYVRPAAPETPSDQPQRPDQPLKQQLPATGEVAPKPASPPPPSPRAIPRQMDKEEC